MAPKSAPAWPAYLAPAGILHADRVGGGSLQKLPGSWLKLLLLEARAGMRLLMLLSLCPGFGSQRRPFEHGGQEAPA